MHILSYKNVFELNWWKDLPKHNSCEIKGMMLVIVVTEGTNEEDQHWCGYWVFLSITMRMIGVSLSKAFSDKDHSAIFVMVAN